MQPASPEGIGAAESEAPPQFHWTRICHLAKSRMIYVAFNIWEALNPPELLPTIRKKKKDIEYQPQWFQVYGLRLQWL